MLRPRLPRVVCSLRRSLHRVPDLEHLRNGVPGLFTPEGFNVAWTEYQGMMIDKLNALTAGTTDESAQPKHLLLKYARQPHMASLFNHASMAYNNHFFFSCLTTGESTIPSGLKTKLESSFTSIETLRREFVAIGNVMFGPGYVWLVKSQRDGGKYSLLNTYLAGSPFAGAHFRQQSTDLNTETPELASDVDFLRSKAKQSLTRGSTSDEKRKLAPGGIDVIPVLCVSTWQHVFMPDWGVQQKKQFLEAWWDRINWDVVAHHSGESARETDTYY